ncbi:hypothetical protein PoB_005743200 [Plakobranchus ocellatus]|uniref:Uncharacterized protein n=1 Tax=Plakobranchus ocellatus TaxID=259542 RepID=A0AAV4CH70_9GAST|nr:hypothetical protein PoB_005743200 [Plakobranchus ocellatus]
MEKIEVVYVEEEIDLVDSSFGELQKMLKWALWVLRDKEGQVHKPQALPLEGHATLYLAKRVVLHLTKQQLHTRLSFSSQSRKRRANLVLGPSLKLVSLQCIVQCSLRAWHAQLTAVKAGEGRVAAPDRGEGELARVGITETHDQKTAQMTHIHRRGHRSGGGWRRKNCATHVAPGDWIDRSINTSAGSRRAHARRSFFPLCRLSLPISSLCF